MSDKIKYVWYASYGSNILSSRLNTYIEGGSLESTNKTYDGCEDKSLPIKSKSIEIDRELYFAKKSNTWNQGGVAFIKINKCSEGKQTLGRMYLISEEQFLDILKQEGNHSERAKIDFNKVIDNGKLIFKDKAWYGNIIYLGIKDDYPIFTFTNEVNISEKKKPSENYLKVIIRGLQETYPSMSNDDIINYLIKKQGINGKYKRSDLIKLITN